MKELINHTTRIAFVLITVPLMLASIGWMFYAAWWIGLYIDKHLGIVGVCIYMCLLIGGIVGAIKHNEEL